MVGNLFLYLHLSAVDKARLTGDDNRISVLNTRKEFVERIETLSEFHTFEADGVSFKYIDIFVS